MADYPDQWESDAVLTDGTPVHLRPIRSDDGPGLLGLYDRLSDESIYLRFFSPIPRMSATQLDRFTHVDYDDRMALVAELGDDIVAVARYDCTAQGEAEVAFTVQDDQQGRGLGTLMLEHLAVIARANGITRFVADTLPNNHKMLNVFRSAGWDIERKWHDGAVRVAFSIAPTDHQLAAVEDRERVADVASAARLLTPRSIAVIGAGRAPGTIGHEVLRNLLAFGFTGPVYPVNAYAHSVAGVRCYASVTDIPDEVDLAVIVVPAAAVRDVVEQCAAKHVRGLVIISAGFAEAGRRQEEHDLVEFARRHGMRVLGPNCMGLVNTARDVRMNATFAPFDPLPGPVAFLSQSGGLGIELMGRARDLGIGISTFVSAGNKADVSSNDLLQHWEQDPDTSVILLYLESFGNPRKFARIARRVARVKPIVAVKSARGRAGRRGAASHTAAGASPDVTVDALFRQAGVIRVDTLEELFDVAQVLAHQPLPPGGRVAIVGNAGGPGILAADACEAAGLEVPELSSKTQQRLRSFVPEGAGVHNPVDLVASATAGDYERALRAVLADENIDAVLTIFVPPLVTKADDVARAIMVAAPEAGERPIVACFLGRAGVHEGLQGDHERRSIPSFAFPESAARALAHAANLSAWRRHDPGIVPDLPGIDVDAARALVARALEGSTPDGTWLPADLAFDLVSCFGMTTCPTRRVATAEEAVAAADAIGYPVALKAGAPALVHKSDAGAVCLDLADGAAVRDAYRDIEARLGAAMGGAVVQPMVESGLETIAGVVSDTAFGPLVMFGLGGVTSDLLGDRAYRIVPVTDVDAAELVRGLRASPLLFGYRGSPPLATSAVEELLIRLGRLADEIPEVAELDANPVVVTQQRAVVLDLKVRVAPAGDVMPPDLRRLN